MRKILKQEVRQEVLSLTTDITYAQVESWYGGTYRDLKMSVIFPKVVSGHKKLPLIVWLCGGAYLRMDRNIWLPQMVSLAQRGFVVASPDYRTSNEVYYPGPLQDIKAAIRYLRANSKKYSIDADHVFIMGESAGGTYATLCSVTNGKKEYDVGENLAFSSDVQGVVDFYGLVDFEHFRNMMDIPAEEEDAVARAVYYFRTKVEEGSAILHINPNTPSTMIFHGTADELIPVSQSENYYAKLQEAGVRSDLYIIEGAMHGDDLFYQENIYDMITEFLNEIMKDK